MTQRSITQAEQDEISHAFSLFDPEQTGRISVEEVKEALEGTDSQKSKQILDKLSQTSKGHLDMRQFTQLMTETSTNDMQRVFSLFDVDQKGYITLDDLKRVAADLGESSMTEAELQEMMQRASSSGRVFPKDFETIMNHKLWS